MKKTLDVCLSPALYHLYDGSDSIVVVIDVLRATSSICIAFEYGVKSIVPVATLEESLAFREQGYLVAAERKGKKVEGFDMGNSPFSYMKPEVKDRNIALTTSNGTQAIEIAKGAHQVVIGSYLNIDALSSWLGTQNKNVILLCAGWKNAVNLEDTIFAGALASELLDAFELTNHRDALLTAMYLHELSKDDLPGFLQRSSHKKRLEKLQIDEDVAFCLTPNQTEVIPVLSGNAIYKLDVLESI